ncbi:HNH endonuclease, partial [candidate division NPL-UPA2 bacterium]|nr:HNH endonuclease [candidate division NPL-UPA2 bacterium]
KEYQEGSKKGFWNLREYILHRDNHECQNPNCNTKNPKLHVHHLGFWQGDLSDRPGNVITLCTRCHSSRNHQPGNLLHGWEPKVKPFRAATFMSSIRWRLVNELNCDHTYGYETKTKRIDLELEKTHHNDAFVIAGGTFQTRSEPIFFKQRRRNNRSLQKFYDAKYIDIRTGEKASGKELFCGRTTRNKDKNGHNQRIYRGEKIAKGRVSIRKQRYPYQPGDIVLFEGKKYTVKGAHNKGTRIILAETSKSVKVESVKILRYGKGLKVI